MQIHTQKTKITSCSHYSLKIRAADKTSSYTHARTLKSYVLDRVFTVRDVRHSTWIRFFIWIIVTAGHQAKTPTRHDWKEQREKHSNNSCQNCTANREHLTFFVDNKICYILKTIGKLLLNGLIRKNRSRQRLTLLA